MSDIHPKYHIDLDVVVSIKDHESGGSCGHFVVSITDHCDGDLKETILQSLTRAFLPVSRHAQAVEDNEKDRLAY